MKCLLNWINILFFLTSQISLAQSKINVEPFDRRGTAVERVTPADIGKVYVIPYGQSQIAVRFQGYQNHNGIEVPRFDQVGADPNQTFGFSGSGSGATAGHGTGAGQGTEPNGVSGTGPGQGGGGKGFGTYDAIGLGLLGFGAANGFNAGMSGSMSAHNVLRQAYEAQLRRYQGDIALMEATSGQLRAGASMAYAGRMSGLATVDGSQVGNLFLERQDLNMRIDLAFQTPIGSQAGKLVREIAHSYQEEWIRREGFQHSTSVEREVFVTGASVLQQADDAFVVGDPIQGQILAKTSKVFLDVLKGSLQGAADSIHGLVHAAPALASALYKFAGVSLSLRSQEEAIELLTHVYKQIPTVAAQIYKSLLRQWKIIQSGTAYERSRLVGRLVTDTVVVGGVGRSVKWIANSGASRAAAASRLGNGPAGIRYTDAVTAIRGEAAQDFLKSPSLIDKANRYQKAVLQIEQSGVTVSENTQDFLSTCIAGEEITTEGRVFTVEQLANVGKYRNDLDHILPKIPKSSFQGSVWRGMEKTYEDISRGVKFEYTESQIGDFTFHGYYNANRFGTALETKQYWTLGSRLEDVTPVILAETKVPQGAEMIISTRQFASNKILDLRAESELVHQITKGADPEFWGKYQYDQALGHAARRNGFEGILYPSQQDSFSHMTNLVIY